jgi:hypothetical protein
METRLNTLLEERRKGHWSAPVRASDWSVTASIRVKVHTRRILQALTLPEYLEAWITMPDSAPDATIDVFGEANGFRLIHSSEGRVVTSVAAYFLSQRGHNLRWYWRKTETASYAWGVVDFRIRDQFDGSVLDVRHSALASAEEYRWHRRLWRNSLRKLASLLQFA